MKKSATKPNNSKKKQRVIISQRDAWRALSSLEDAAREVVALKAQLLQADLREKARSEADEALFASIRHKDEVIVAQTRELEKKDAALAEQKTARRRADAESGRVMRLHGRLRDTTKAVVRSLDRIADAACKLPNVDSPDDPERRFYERVCRVTHALELGLEDSDPDADDPRAEPGRRSGKAKDKPGMSQALLSALPSIIGIGAASLIMLAATRGAAPGAAPGPSTPP